ncbi:host nuclease inhibitor protein [Escherichia coli]|nr:host nuclease inhibitor protein [Escherichia coli]
MKKITAYVWASGLIEFGDVVPDGALPVISGEPKTVKNAIEVLARHSRTRPVQLLVPGIPEAPDQRAVQKALIRFCRDVRFRVTRPRKAGVKRK